MKINSIGKGNKTKQHLPVMGSHLLYSGIAGAMSGSTPLFSFILGVIFLNEEKINFCKVLGLILGLAGIILLAKPFNADRKSVV